LYGIESRGLPFYSTHLKSYKMNFNVMQKCIVCVRYDLLFYVSFLSDGAMI